MQQWPRTTLQESSGALRHGMALSERTTIRRFCGSLVSARAWFEYLPQDCQYSMPSEPTRLFGSPNMFVSVYLLVNKRGGKQLDSP